MFLISASDDEDGDGAAGGIGSGLRHAGVITGKAKAAALDILSGERQKNGRPIGLEGMEWEEVHAPIDSQGAS